ncbi:MAG: hypothetical protein ACYS3N_08805 [Planctomycetota bacterium]|jgi:hypothetical protein
MSEKERNKAGLHKKISSIFSGVLIPQPDSSQEPSGTCIPEDADNAEHSQPAPESLESESPKPYQAAQILPETEPVEESRVDPIEESRIEPVEESRVEPIEESGIEAVEKSGVEPVQETDVEPAHTPKFVTAQESKVIPVEESEIESLKDSKSELAQETKDRPASHPKFMTAQESKVIPVEESEIESLKDSKSEPAQETKDRPASPPKFMTAQESKVIPVEESEVESTKQSEAEPAQQPKDEPVHKGKFEKAKKPNVIPVKESKKTGIDKISKKVSKKHPVVKVSGESSWKQITGKLFAGNSDAGTTKQKAMVVIVPALFVVLLIVVFKGGVFGTSVHNAEAGEENNNSGVVSAGLNNQIDWEIPEPYPTTLRDPMQLGPVVTRANQNESGELVKLIVKSILYSEDNSSAIIGNRIVYEGDQIQDASITKINKNSVEFEVNGKKWSQGVQR